MKTITLVCNSCGEKFEKPLKEYTRQIKNGRNNFYCSRSCAGKGSMSKNLGKHLGKGRPENLDAYNRHDVFTPFRHYMNQIRTRNVEQGKQFDVDVEYLKEMWDNQQGKCSVTGVGLVLERTVSNPNYTASVDRIDSSKGYMKGNIRFVSVIVNYAKNSYDDNVLQEFFDIIRNIGDA